MVKIGISCYPTHGGSGAVAAGLAIELAKRGHELHVLSYRMPFRLRGAPDGVTFHEVEILHYPLFEYPSYHAPQANKMAEVAREYGLDIIHVHYSIPDSAAACLAKDMLGEKAPRIVATMHGTDITVVGRDPAVYELSRYVLRRLDGRTAISEYMRRRAIEEFDLDVPIEVIPNFVDTARFRLDPCPKMRARFAPHGERILTHISNFRPVKRVEDVVRIFERVRREIAAKLLLVGDGPDRPRASQLAERLGVSQDVISLGLESNVEEFLCTSDVFLLPSAEEGFGLAALEAMAAGVPVVATDYGGLPECVANGETGFLHEVGDVEAMAASALRLATDCDLRKKMSRAARQRAVTRFATDAVIAQYEAFYERVLGS
jgi:N-acetyl-alpha-D-glucosaminyl L-malate synthase BshA